MLGRSLDGGDCSRKRRADGLRALGAKAQGGVGGLGEVQVGYRPVKVGSRRARDNARRETRTIESC